MAVEQSVAQMALTRDTGAGGFMERLTAILAETASSILTEAGTTAFHAQRAAYAVRVTQNAAGAAMAAGPLVVMGVNVVQKTTYDEATKTSTCTATDLELQSQILTDWNALA